MNPPTYCYNEVQVTSPVNASNQSEAGRSRADAELRCGTDDLRPRELSGSSVAMAFKLGNGEKSRSIGLEREVSPTLNSECGGNKPAVFIGDTDEQAKD